MPKEKLFYHATTRKLITIFGSIFNELYIDLDPSSPPYKVPLHFATREKFMTILDENPDPYSATAGKQYVWLAFALTGLSYSTERATNNTSKIKSTIYEGDYIYNRVPYDLTFEVYISTKHLESSFQIVEQIIPIFKPSFQVKVNELERYDLKTDISISLDSISPILDYEGSMQEQKNVFWQLGFTMKAWYYPPYDKQDIINTVKARIAKCDYDPFVEFDNKLNGI